MKLGMTWADLHMLSVLSKIGLPIFFVFSLLSFLRFAISKVDSVNKYLVDKTNTVNIILNYIQNYKIEIIIILCFILTLFVLFNSNIFKIKFNLINMVTIFIYLFGLLILLTQLFFLA